LNTPLFKQALSGIGRSILQFLGSSLKWKIEDPYHFLQNEDQKPYLVTFWHNRILMIAYIYSQILPHRRAKTLISPSRDGEWITSIIEQFGFSAIRGSTSKKGALAFRELLQVVKKENCDIGITPDGPRGPVYRVQPGVIRLSQLTGRPILPVTYHIQHKIELKSWDRFQIPIPLSEITLVLGKPRVIPREMTDDQLQGEIEWLQNILGK
jgi:lysophospholipid acyltransferase (LPLAT)-like uncharacterized protein